MIFKMPHQINQVLITLTSALLITGCVNPKQQNTLLGAGAGGALGAGVGALVGNTQGAVVGSALGAAAGGAAGYNWSSIKDRLKGNTNAEDAQIVEQNDGSLKVNIPSSVSFDTNQSVLKPAVYSAIDQVIITMQQHPELIAQIIGHTDNSGSAVRNKTLSLNRARSVANYLIKQNIPVNRILFEGQGSQNPIADNATPAGRLQNRRVEILLRPVSTAAPVIAPVVAPVTVPVVPIQAPRTRIIN